MNEKLLQNKVIKYLKDNNIFFEKRQAGGFNYRIGLPDIYFVINGKHYEIELKDPRKKIIYKSEQIYWNNKFKEYNIESIISNDFEEIKTFINSKIKK